MLSGAFKTDSEYDYGKILGAAGGAASFLYLFGEGSSNRPMGYQGSIPSYTVSRMQVPGLDPDRRPGSGGQRYFTDVQFDGGTHLNGLRVWKRRKYKLGYGLGGDSHLRPSVPQKTQPLLKLQHKLH